MAGAPRPEPLLDRRGSGSLTSEGDDFPETRTESPTEATASEAVVPAIAAPPTALSPEVQAKNFRAALALSKDGDDKHGKAKKNKDDEEEEEEEDDEDEDDDDEPGSKKRPAARKRPAAVASCSKGKQAGIAANKKAVVAPCGHGKQAGMAANKKADGVLKDWLKKAKRCPVKEDASRLRPGGCAKCRWSKSGCSSSCFYYLYGLHRLS